MFVYEDIDAHVLQHDPKIEPKRVEHQISSSGKPTENWRFLDLGTTTVWGSCLRESDDRKEIPLDPFLVLSSHFGKYHHRSAGLIAFLNRNELSIAPSLVCMAMRSFVELISFLLMELFAEDPIVTRNCYVGEPRYRNRARPLKHYKWNPKPKGNSRLL